MKENFVRNISFMLYVTGSPSLGVVVHHEMVQCRGPLLGHSDLLFGKPKENLVQSIPFVVVLN